MKNQMIGGTDDNIDCRGVYMNKEIKNNKIISDMIDYWKGKPNNPLNGKTFAEIEWLGTMYGIDLKGLKDVEKRVI